MALEVGHRTRPDRGRLEIGCAADDRDARGSPSSAAASGDSGASTSVAPIRSGSWDRSMPASASSSGAYAMRDRSRLSVSQCITIESNVAAARPVSLRLSQSFGSRYFQVARDVGSLGLQPEDVGDRILARSAGAPPVSRMKVRNFRGS